MTAPFEELRRRLSDELTAAGLEAGLYLKSEIELALTVLASNPLVIARMGQKLLDQIALEDGCIHIGAPWEAESIARDMLEAAKVPEGE